MLFGCWLFARRWSYDGGGGGGNGDDVCMHSAVYVRCCWSKRHRRIIAASPPLLLPTLWHSNQHYRMHTYAEYSTHSFSSHEYALSYYLINKHFCSHFEHKMVCSWVHFNGGPVSVVHIRTFDIWILILIQFCCFYFDNNSRMPHGMMVERDVGFSHWWSYTNISKWMNFKHLCELMNEKMDGKNSIQLRLLWLVMGLIDIFFLPWSRTMMNVQNAYRCNIACPCFPVSINRCW